MVAKRWGRHDQSSGLVLTNSNREVYRITILLELHPCVAD